MKSPQAIERCDRLAARDEAERLRAQHVARTQNQQEEK